MTDRVRFKQADVARALKAAKSVGLRPSAYTIGLDGSLTINLGNDNHETTNTFDTILGARP